jgi:hypothetical protein
MMGAMSPSRWAFTAPAAFACSLCLATPAVAQESCFVRLDNGVDMTGWQLSATNHHGPGDGWSVEDGAFVGRQTAGQQGGILMTDASYTDVEVLFEVKITWGCDSGFFFRTTGGDRAYQVNVDFLEGGGVGSIWGEAFTQELRIRPFTLTDMGMTAVVEPNETPLFDLSTWSSLWNVADFNTMRVRVEGNPPRIQSWIADVQVMDFTDTLVRAEIEAAGPLAIQVHGGAERWLTDGAVAYRNIRVKDLTLPCDEPDPGSGGTAGSGGSAAGAAGASGMPGGGQAGGGAGGAPTMGGSSGAGQGGAPSSAGSAPTAAPASSSESGGCGCRLMPARSRSWWMLAAFGLVVAWRRSAQKRRPAPA